MEIILDSVGIRKYLPHRYPFALVDRIVQFEDGKRILGVKNVTINEVFFSGHFPTNPVMPGVLVLEAMAQVGALFAKLCTNGIPKDQLVLFVGVDNCRWKRKVVPGDTLHIEMRLQKRRGAVWIMEGKTTVEGELACEATLMAMKG